MVEFLHSPQHSSALPVNSLIAADEVVVVVDDSPEIVLILSHYLAHLGFSIRKASSAAELFAILAEEKAALVLLDIGLSDRSGEEVLQSIAVSDPDLGIIMVTGTTDLETALSCLRAGADDYLTKPVGFDQFTKAVTATLTKRKLIVENKRFQQELEKSAYKNHFLHQLNQAMNTAYLTMHELDGILHTILVGITAQEGLRFNRAFLALYEEHSGILRGRMAIGPSSPEEAGRVWESISTKHLSFNDILLSYHGSSQDQDQHANSIAQRITVLPALTDHIMIAASQQRKSLHVQKGHCETAVNLYNLPQILRHDTFVVTPLYSPSRSIGVLIVDNMITSSPIQEEDIQTLELFASQASLAIERSRLHEEMMEKIHELENVTRELDQSRDLLVAMEKYSAIGQMSAQLVHAIRNPLTSIGGAARLLLKKTEDQYFTNFLDIICKETSKIEASLQVLFAFVENKPLQLLEQSLPALLRKSILAFQTHFQKTGVQCQLIVPDEDIRLAIDGIRLQEAFLQLQKNALEAMPDGGKLLIELRQETDSVTISFRDSGEGLSISSSSKALDPFYTTKTYGTGMGLALVQHIVTQHGGTLTLKKTDSTAGAIATIQLPLPAATDSSS